MSSKSAVTAPSGDAVSTMPTTRTGASLMPRSFGMSISADSTPMSAPTKTTGVGDWRNFDSAAAPDGTPITGPNFCVWVTKKCR